MKASKKSLAVRDSGRDIGAELIQAIRELQAGKIGRRFEVKPTINEVVKARLGTGLSQAEFAAVLKISPRTLQQWEQGRRVPSGAAETLLRIVARHPEVLRDLV